MNPKQLIALVTLTLLLLESSGFAQGIRIIDCRGKTRAVKQQPAQAAQNNVKVDVVDAQGQPVEQGQFKLVNAKGEVLEAVAKDGLVEFANVDPGLWMITSDQTGFYFSSISLTDSLVPAFWQQVGNVLLDAGKVLVVTGAVVGAAVLVDEVSDGGGANGDSNNPPSMGCPACDPDTEAPSIPSFE